MLFALALLLQAQAADPTAQVILRLEDAWAVALVRRDSLTFERLLAPGFIYSENDRTLSRSAFLREVFGGADTVTSAHNEAMEVHRFGVAAVVTGWLVVRGRSAGRPFDRRYRYTDVWLPQGGRWRIVAAHDYLAPP